MYHLIETVFDKPDAFDIPYTDKLKILMELSIFYFESTMMEDEELKVTETTIWI